MNTTTRDTLTTGAAAVLLLAAGAYVVRTTVQDLAPASDASDAAASLWQLILLALAGALLTYALIELLEKLSPLRALFNERALGVWFESIPSYRNVGTPG